jgi:hypothetical protein
MSQMNSRTNTPKPEPMSPDDVLRRMLNTPPKQQRKKSQRRPK